MKKRSLSPAFVSISLVLIVAFSPSGSLFAESSFDELSGGERMYRDSNSRACPPGGDAVAGDGDAEQNRVENRIKIPANYVPTKIEDIVALRVPTQVAKKKRKDWPHTALIYIETQELRAVEVEGTLIYVRYGYPSSKNCYSKDLDYQLLLAASPEDGKGKGLVVEVTPRIRVNHPGWTLKKLRQFATEHTPVKISGWLLLNPNYSEQVGRSRASMWEIHPAMKIEFLQDGQWIEL